MVTLAALCDELDFYEDSIALGVPIDRVQLRVALWFWSLALAAKRR